LKLASMGRLTASIAHEIRNPLAAISHASQILVEDAQEAPFKRLASIVRENTVRLNRLVDDILRVARREAPVGDDIDLAGFLDEWLQEFVRDRSLPSNRIVLQVADGVRIRFEQSHLRQVMYNLLDNSLRYASETPGAVRVLVEFPPEGAALWVLDDGPGVPEAVRGSLFEPFTTTHVKGTGLGLYIAREFCLANRSELAYGDHSAAGSVTRHGFVIRFAPRQPAPQDIDFLDTVVPYE
jgi:two-component system sensor histidine kinase PilS (NtrC family)